jgi:hypothetical protein
MVNSYDDEDDSQWQGEFIYTQARREESRIVGEKKVVWRARQNPANRFSKWIQEGMRRG